MMHKISILLTLLISILLYNTCSKSTAPPPPPDNEPDTTSHDIFWQLDTIGSYPSKFYDIAAISATDIWAVGEIYTKDTYTYDSLGNWIDPHNAAHWDGEKWELKRFYYDFRVNFPEGTPGKVWAPISSIYAFENGEIWLKCGTLHYFNGKTWKEYKSLYSINKIWGTSSKDLYVVGNGGYIAHYAGESWQKMESETDISLTDIYGSPDGSVIWACGFDDIKGSVLLRNSGFGFEKIIEITEVPEYPTPNKIEYIFRSIWTDSPDSIYIGSVGRIYKAPSDTKGYTKTSLWWDYLNSSINPPPTYSIRANTKNDLFISGGSQFVRHFNGKDWHYYAEIKGNGVWTSISLLPDIIVCAGFLFEYDETAIIARGYRAY